MTFFFSLTWPRLKFLNTILMTCGISSMFLLVRPAGQTFQKSTEISFYKMSMQNFGPSWFPVNVSH